MNKECESWLSEEDPTIPNDDKDCGTGFLNDEGKCECDEGMEWDFTTKVCVAEVPEVT